jgi:hypothetical protein
MKHPIEVPPELFAEWLAEGRKQYSEPALIAGFVAEKAAQYGADEQLYEVNEWIRCSGSYPKTDIRWELDMLQLDRLSKELWQAMRPKPPSLKEQALRLVFDYGASKYSYTAEQTATIRRALESIPDADS